MQSKKMKCDTHSHVCMDAAVARRGGRAEEWVAWTQCCLGDGALMIAHRRVGDRTSESLRRTIFDASMVAKWFRLESVYRMEMRETTTSALEVRNAHLPRPQHAA